MKANIIPPATTEEKPKYPYIGKEKIDAEGIKVLFVDEGQGCMIKTKFNELGDLQSWDEDDFIRAQVGTQLTLIQD